MATLHKIGSPLTAESRVKLNENWDIIEQMLSSFRRQLQFVSGVDDIEAVIKRLDATMNNVDVLQKRFTDSLNHLETESDRILTESETNLHNQLEEIERQAEARLTKEIADLQNQIVSTIATLQTNIETGETLQQETTELIDRLNTALDEMEKRIVNAIERTDTAIQAVNDERARLEQMKVMGDYDAGTSYAEGNMVAFEGSTYAARKATTGVAPVAYETSDTWQLIARRGLDGLGTVSYINGVGADDDGNVTIEKGNIGLENVDNTADLEKPLSTAQIAALDQMAVNLRTMGAAGDGSNARQTMLDALEKGNETILVPKGTYTLKEILLRRNVRIVGTGWDSVLKLPTDLTTSIRGLVDGVEGISNAMFAINEPVHITFENLTFDGDCFNQSEIYNGGCFLRIFKPALETEQKINVTFKNCQFINNNHTVIGAYGSGRSDYIFVNVYDCYFGGGTKGTTQTAITSKWAQGYAPHYISTYDNITLTIEGNKFIDDILPDNVKTFGRVAINATVTDTTSVANSDKLSTSMFVSNNVFKNLGRNAASPNGLGVIDMYVNGENAVITGNKFINSQMQSIRGKVNVKNLIVSNNVIVGGIDGGIAFHPNNFASKKGNTVIANNIVENTKGYGILLNGDSSTDTNPYFENAIVTGNLVKGITAVAYRADLANGIYLKKVRNATVANNQLMNILNDGLYAESVNGLTISNNLIKTTTNEANLGRGIYGKLLLGSVSIENNSIYANSAAVYMTFLVDNVDNINRSVRMVHNHFLEIRNATSQGIYVSDFLMGVVAHNIIDGMKAASGATAYAFNFKGGILHLVGNIYADILGLNNDPTSMQYAIKLKGNVTTLKELYNSWQ